MPIGEAQPIPGFFPRIAGSAGPTKVMVNLQASIVGLTKIMKKMSEGKAGPLGMKTSAKSFKNGATLQHPGMLDVLKGLQAPEGAGMFKKQLAGFISGGAKGYEAGGIKGAIGGAIAGGPLIAVTAGLAVIAVIAGAILKKVTKLVKKSETGQAFSDLVGGGLSAMIDAVLMPIAVAINGLFSGDDTPLGRLSVILSNIMESAKPFVDEIARFVSLIVDNIGGIISYVGVIASLVTVMNIMATFGPILLTLTVLFEYVKTAMSLFLPVLSALQPAFEFIIGLLMGSFLPTLMDLASSFMELIKVAFIPLMVTLLPVLIPMLTGLIVIIGGIVAVVSVLTIAFKVLGAIFNIVTIAVKFVAGIFYGLVSSILDVTEAGSFLKNVFNSIKDAFVRFANSKAVQSIVNIINSIGDAFKNLKDIASGGGAFDAGKDFIGGLF